MSPAKQGMEHSVRADTLADVIDRVLDKGW